jgi:hypothetical protein
VPTPSPESFAALARSSPWLWSTLRFTGHDLRIEAVDEPMGDDLFVEPRRGLFR